MGLRDLRDLRGAQTSYKHGVMRPKPSSAIWSSIAQTAVAECEPRNRLSAAVTRQKAGGRWLAARVLSSFPGNGSSALST
jgi:hypothetical protein